MNNVIYFTIGVIVAFFVFGKVELWVRKEEDWRGIPGKMPTPSSSAIASLVAVAVLFLWPIPLVLACLFYAIWGFGWVVSKVYGSLLHQLRKA